MDSDKHAIKYNGYCNFMIPVPMILILVWYRYKYETIFYLIALSNMKVFVSTNLPFFPVNKTRSTSETHQCSNFVLTQT